ncbi:hypothetical protein AMTR_s00081p00023760 [Amborella trichopoda]|uniref:Uncharacterized protein n=1 Tax=Amborella trichopoda TaxID=13333 RepID=W1PA41_AMBTC|nr:hypothetical protein AMTR_s00081p00023760 [Amborella trichopoda]
MPHEAVTTALAVDLKEKTIVSVAHKDPHTWDTLLLIFSCIILATLRFKVSRETIPQEPLLQHQDVEILPNKEPKEESHSSITHLGVISMEGGHPAQLKRVYEGVDTHINEEPSYILADGVITCLTRHDRHFKPA